ncbi:efflux transporter outer membrane subunit [Novosphingobium percolationis]|uniref:efflux transporter outer membrane subunit n=1 Tax=Novosphingobium percolationis TaxID=2871811 RepID=UPI001CD424AB|nr:efflux transporter outer membrane subunit [Novosphingobium percolationis]
MKRLAAFASVLALAGCTVGPDYHLPDQAEINRPASKGALSGTGGLTAADPLPARWWALYDDPVLARLEEQALAANTDLRVAGANLARSAAMVRAVQGAGDPQLAVDAAVQRARISGESFLKFETIPVATLGEGGAELSYQVDLFGQIKRRVEEARADHEATEALVEVVQVSVAAEVARAYVAVCGGNEALDLAEEAVAAQERMADAARRLHAAGKIGAVEVTRAEAALLDTQAQLPAAHARVQAELYRLAFLTGRAPAEYPREAEQCHTVPQLARPLPVGDAAMLLARRPDVRAAERLLAASSAATNVARADLYPHVGIGLGGGTTGLVGDLLTAMSGRWAFGGMISWAFPSRTARAKVAAGKAGEQRALADFDGTVLRALRETETALTWYRENHNRAVTLGEARAQAELLAAQQRRLHQAGKADLQADLGGQARLIEARDRERAARDAVAQSQVDLFLALGGGW